MNNSKQFATKHYRRQTIDSKNRHIAIDINVKEKKLDYPTFQRESKWDKIIISSNYPTFD